MSQQLQVKDPPFGHHLGLWYPLAWRILATNRYWSPSMWLPKDSALAIDIYIGIWWLIEFACVVLCNNIFDWQGTATWVCLILVLFRLNDLMFVLYPTGWLSKSLAIIEASSIILVVIAVISYIIGVKKDQK